MTGEAVDRTQDGETAFDESGVNHIWETEVQPVNGDEVAPAA